MNSKFEYENDKDHASVNDKVKKRPSESTEKSKQKKEFPNNQN